MYDKIVSCRTTSLNNVLQLPIVPVIFTDFDHPFSTIFRFYTSSVHIHNYIYSIPVPTLTAGELIFLFIFGLRRLLGRFLKTWPPLFSLFYPRDKNGYHSCIRGGVYDDFEVGIVSQGHR